MKIVHVIASLTEEHGGPSRACRDMAACVAQQGHEVVIHTTDFLIPPEEAARSGQSSADGVTVHYHPTRDLSPWLLPSSMRKGVGQDVESADAVHLHSFWLPHCWLTWRHCKRTGTPFLLRPHGSLDPWVRKRSRIRKRIANAVFMNRVVDDAWALHFTTEEEQELAAPVTRGKRGVVIPNGIHADHFADLPDGSIFRDLFPDEARVLLFLSRLHRKKGLDVLAPAFAEILENESNARLLVVGPDDGAQESFRADLSALDVIDRVHFAGMTRGAEKLAAFAAAELFVLPSWTENFGISVVEAMAAGLPVVISDRINIHEDITEDQAGLVVAPDSGAVAGAVLNLLGDRNRLQQIGENARIAARKRYDWSSITPQLIEVYRSMVEDRSPSFQSA